MKKGTAILFYATFVLAMLNSCRVIKPEAPSLPSNDVPSAQQPKSEIDIPISAELGSYIQQAETSVPNEYSGNEQPCQGLRYAFMFRRSPFNINGSGNNVDLGFQGQYWIDLTYCAKCLFNNCVVPKVGASCGVGEPLRRIDIGYRSTLTVLPNYRLSSSTSLTMLNPVDRCTVTILNIDATDRLINMVRGPLNNLGGKVDEKISGIDFRPQVQALWDRISSEIKIGDFGYLNVNPQSLRLSSMLNFQGTSLSVSVGATVIPVIKSESSSSQSAPLPDLSDYIPGNGFNVYLDMRANYDTLSRYINNELAGQVILIEKKKFIITNAHLYGIGNQKIVIAVSFKGKRKGTVYLTGTPSYNSISHELSFLDLEFDIKTRDLLLKIAKWIFNEKITGALKEKAHYDFSSLLEKTRIKLQDELTRDLGGNIRTSGTINRINIEDIYPGNSVLILRTLANGKLTVTLE